MTTGQTIGITIGVILLFCLIAEWHFIGGDYDQ